MEPKQKIRKKRKIIANHEARMKISQLCEEYQVPRSTVQHILKTKDKIKDACVKIERLQGNCASRKHIG
ncbi:hypothetical protein NQ318_003228 [Aromia moschata]|uniref:HTH psq-type domain-containing protein n=1 Tax=Aromia moschata TaxID=1265417 RepID=A0AAV8YQX0_9CUCU|nr:hypothetical protein NQ318_003228 [Aromia moschata]